MIMLHSQDNLHDSPRGVLLSFYDWGAHVLTRGIKFREGETIWSPDFLKGGNLTWDLKLTTDEIINLISLF